MTLARLLDQWSDELARRSSLELHHARLKHYEGIDGEELRLRLRAWLDHAQRCLVTGRADLVIEHAQRIATERFAAGYDLAEVQTSINIVKEVLSHRILSTMLPGEAAGALCLINALFSVTKDALAQTYVALAMQQREHQAG